MSLSIILFITGFLGGVIVIKKYWMWGIVGLPFVPFLVYFNISSGIMYLFVDTLISFPLGLSCGFISAIIYSGVKGRGHNFGPTYGIGFGAHHPGGIILSDEERKVLKDRNIKREFIISY